MLDVDETYLHLSNQKSLMLEVDLVISLHACGQASDQAIVQAVRAGAPYIIAPCCVGKLKFSLLNNTNNTNNNNNNNNNFNSKNNFNKNKKNSKNEKNSNYAFREAAFFSREWAPLPYPRSRWLRDAFLSDKCAANTELLRNKLYAG